ncbi:helix-turn-helix protein [Larkinella arboricola]|uniref:Helix-turn-helix protein n=1 Tax=Larkinella arboricola TaxID=643671 RepID=A0A327WWA8_LARAB|nr:helix-turn-helix domain-containing protein [Larkinella arboricola]RAJ97591.1 helix-turn-helix protein [Larkinella arboricola]
MDVSNNIRSIREKKGLTQVDVANRMSTERSNYARLENRGINLTLKQVQEIADALEVSVYDIIGKQQTSESSNEQREILQRLEEKLRMTEETLKDKKRNIKLYKSFIEWTREKFQEQFTVITLLAVNDLGMREITPKTDEEVNIDYYNFTEQELKKIGDYMFSSENTNYFLADFIALCGFVSEKWFIDAYKRHNRRNKEKVAFAEVKNWVNGIFGFLEEE